MTRITLMERKIVKKNVMALSLTSRASRSFLFPEVAYAWNQATPAYIVERLIRPEGGSSAPDFFNYIFDPRPAPTGRRIRCMA